MEMAPFRLGAGTVSWDEMSRPITPFGGVRISCKIFFTGQSADREMTFRSRFKNTSPVAE